MRVAIRVDSSATIGSGHVMRCVALAGKLRRRGAEVRFFCRALPGHLGPVLSASKYPVTFLSSSVAAEPPSWEAEAEEMLGVMEQALHGVASYDWLVVDHYGLDVRWERSVRQRATRVLVLDDLADRQHDCDVLIDANYLPDLERRYQGKVPPSCRTLLGPGYVLLRDEFYRVRPSSRERILVSFGGHDVARQTLRVARVLVSLPERRQPVDLVIGRAAPDLDQLTELCERTAGFALHVQATNLAELLSRAQFSIGGGGITTLERLFLRVPTLALATTQPEEEPLQALDADGYLRYLGSYPAVSDDELASAITRQLTRPETFRAMPFPADDSWFWHELQEAAAASEARGDR